MEKELGPHCTENMVVGDRILGGLIKQELKIGDGKVSWGNDIERNCRL